MGRRVRSAFGRFAGGDAGRPGVELVVAAHKSVAVLGVVGRAEDMHAILDAESDATLAFLDVWARDCWRLPRPGCHTHR